jgi:L-2,4-diaminobutyric acid acetyltransferase
LHRKIWSGEERDPDGITIRNFHPEDVDAIHNLVGEFSPQLTQHEQYVYQILAKYTPSRCFVATDDGEAIGFVTSFLSDSKPLTLFLWQGGIRPEYRGMGIMDKLMDRIGEVAISNGTHAIEITTTPDNTSAIKSVKRLGSRLQSEAQKIDEFARPSPLVKSALPQVLYRIPL